MAALCATDEKANFQRLVRLLMCGGHTLLREVFDSIHPPAGLSAMLHNHATRNQLQTLKSKGILTQPEWNHLYLPTGGYGKSADFDVSLLFKLLRNICSLTRPATGWDSLPNIVDHSLEADLARIKYYRNSVYAHNYKMEITDADFDQLWSDISEALLRIAGRISTAKRDEWKKAIDKLLNDPLTPDAEQNVTELELWCKKDMETKDELEKLRNEVEQMRLTLNIIVEHLKANESAISHTAGQHTSTAHDFWHVVYSFKKSIEVLFKYLRIKLGVDPQDSRLGSLVITVSCSCMEVLEGLWIDYRSGHLNEVVQETLVTKEVLEELGLSEVKLKTIISDTEYKACKKFLKQKSGQTIKKKKKKERKEIPHPAVPTVVKPTALGQTIKKEKEKEIKEICHPALPTRVKPAELGQTVKKEKKEERKEIPFLVKPAALAVRTGHHPGTDNVYNMTAHPRGIMLIINNNLFADNPLYSKLPTLHGSEKDVHKVEELFSALGFAVHTKENLTKQQLIHELDSVACQDHSKYDCFVLWLMSYGKSGKVLCSDGLMLPIQSTHDMFCKCETLRGKPKLFFISTHEEYDRYVFYTQSAFVSATRQPTLPPHFLRGETKPMTTVIQYTSSHADPVKPLTTALDIQADFLYALDSTVDEYDEYRHPYLRIFYIDSLVEAFQECAVHDHLLDIATEKYPIKCLKLSTPCGKRFIFRASVISLPEIAVTI